MADRLYLSLWLQNYSPLSMLHHYEKLLKAFPYSRLMEGQALFTIHGLSFSEPPLRERMVQHPPNIDELLADAREFQSQDNSYELETAWDLWTWEDDWHLQPQPLAIHCFGPEFDDRLDGEHLRIDFGQSSVFLPEGANASGLRMVAQNVQSLLRLVKDLDGRLPLERRALWTETGENFAERLQAGLPASGRLN